MVALAGCAAGGGGPRDRYAPLLTARADPGAVVATEIAFARAAQEKGQWTAFREYAAADAVMFVPQPVKAQDWLKKQADPDQAVKWQPHEVWSSCDGSLAITRGAAQWPNGGDGEFMTMWQRQADGAYRWIADIGHSLAAPLAAPEFIVTHIADCSSPVPPDQRFASSERPATKGQSADGSLQYLVHTMEGGSTVTLGMWDGSWRTFGPKVFAAR